MKKIISILICLIMTISVIPFASSADAVQSDFELTFAVSPNVGTKVTVHVVDRNGDPFPVTCSQTNFDINMDDAAGLEIIFPSFRITNNLKYNYAGAYYGSVDGPRISYIAQRYRKGVQNVFFLTDTQITQNVFTRQYNGDYYNAVDVVSSSTLYTHNVDIYVVYDTGETVYSVSHPRSGKADVVILCDMSRGMDAEVSAGVTRRDVVTQKVCDFAESLLAHNAGEEECVRVALVAFGNANYKDPPFFTEFEGAGGFAAYLESLRSVDFGAGRNWENALRTAWIYWRDKQENYADRYVILISEGSATCRRTKGSYSYFGAMENNGDPTVDPATGVSYYSLGYDTAGEDFYNLGLERNFWPALIHAKSLVRRPRRSGGGADLRTIQVFDDGVYMLDNLKYFSCHDSYDSDFGFGDVDGYTFAAGGDALETALDDLYNEIATYVPLPEPPAPTVIPGDANGDGDVDIKDVYTLKKIVAGAAMITPGSDVDLDGSVDSKDVKALKAIVAGS